MWCALTATSTGPSIWSGRSAGCDRARILAVNCSTGPSIRRPAVFTALTTAGIGVADQHVVAIADQTGRDRAADRTAAENHVSHGVHVTTQ